MTQPDADPSYWQEQGLCKVKGVELNVFFPRRGESLVPARAICDLCEVEVQCLNEALETNVKYGVWGGKSERERRSIRKQRGASSSVGPLTVENADIGDF